MSVGFELVNFVFSPGFGIYKKLLCHCIAVHISTEFLFMFRKEIQYECSSDTVNAFLDNRFIVDGSENHNVGELACFLNSCLFNLAKMFITSLSKSDIKIRCCEYKVNFV